MSAARSFYDEWSKNKSYKFKLSKSGDFAKLLLEGQVDAFDLTQNCNMNGEFRRCFYKLIETDVVYQETPCDEPKLQWKKTGDTLVKIYCSDHGDIWSYIYNHYMIQNESAYQVHYKHKEENSNNESGN